MTDYLKLADEAAAAVEKSDGYDHSILLELVGSLEQAVRELVRDANDEMRRSFKLAAELQAERVDARRERRK